MGRGCQHLVRGPALAGRKLDHVRCDDHWVHPDCPDRRGSERRRSGGPPAVAEAALVVVALSVEVFVFLMTTVLVDRPRPAVPRLDAAPPTSSFPSGHTAAAIALWVSGAILMSLHIHNARAPTVA